MRKYFIGLTVVCLAAAFWAMVWLLGWDVPGAVSQFVDAISMRGFAPSPLHCQTEVDGTEGQAWSLPANQAR